jgi:hypothetical protein
MGAVMPRVLLAPGLLEVVVTVIDIFTEFHIMKGMEE